MDGPAGGTGDLQKDKLELLEALTGDAEYLLQHCHAHGILSNNEYNNIKDLGTRSEQVRDVLDCVINKGNKHAERFLKLLKTEKMQENFPKLQFLQKQQSNKRRMPKITETTAKKRRPEKDVLKEQRRITNSRPVSEREMMKVAGYVGNSWKELGIMALGMNTTTLQQIEEDNKLHKERVFAMLRKWSIRERDQATAARLHTLLTQEESDVDPRNLHFLLENS